MSEIKVGEYVRTIRGEIGIFEKYSSRKETSIYKSNFDHFIILQGRKTHLQCDKSYILKHSKNIIDLIEVGDAIKYKELRHFSNYETNFNKEYIVGIHNVNELKNMKKEVKNNKIKVIQIYTKEQLKCIGYEVKGE